MAQSLGDRAKDERELVQLVKDLSEAVVRGDVVFLDRVLHEDYAHHRPNGIVENRAQYLDNRKARRVHFDSLVADEIKVRVYGDTAVVTGRSTAKGKDQHGKMDDQRHWTRVLVRRDGRWQFVNFHAALIRKP